MQVHMFSSWMPTTTGYAQTVMKMEKKKKKKKNGSQALCFFKSKPDSDKM